MVKKMLKTGLKNRIAVISENKSINVIKKGKISFSGRDPSKRKFLFVFVVCFLVVLINGDVMSNWFLGSSQFASFPEPSVAGSTSIVTVLKIEANTTIIESGQAVTFYLTLYYQDPSTLVFTPFPRQNVTFVWLNDTSMNAMLETDNEGKANVTWVLSTTSFGNHAFKGSYQGNVSHSPSEDFLVVDIRDRLPVADPSNVNDVWFQGIQFNATSYSTGDTMRVTFQLQAGGGSYLGPGIFQLFDETMGIELYHEDVPFIMDFFNYPSHSFNITWQIPLHAPEGVHSLKFWYSGDSYVKSGFVTKTITINVHHGLTLEHASSVIRSQESLLVTVNVLGPSPENKRVVLEYRKNQSSSYWKLGGIEAVVNRRTTFTLATNKTWELGNYTLRATLQSLDGSVNYTQQLSWFLLMGQASLTITPSVFTLHENKSISWQLTIHAADSNTVAVPSIITIRDETDGILIFNGTTDSQGELPASWTPQNLSLGIHHLNFSVRPLSSWWFSTFQVISAQFVASSTIVPRSLPAEIVRGTTVNVTLSIYRNSTGEIIVDPTLVVRLVDPMDTTRVLAETALVSSEVILSYRIPMNASSGPMNFTLLFPGNDTLSSSSYNFTVNVFINTHFLGYTLNYSSTKTISAGMSLEIRALLTDDTNSPLARQQVTVTIGSSITLQGFTDDIGWVTLIWRIPFSQPTQLYSIIISFSGNFSAYLLATDNIIVDSVRVTPSLAVSSLGQLYRGNSGSVLVTGPGNEMVTLKWLQQLWNDSTNQWVFSNVTYQVTLNSTGQAVLTVNVPLNVMVGPTTWYLNSSLAPQNVIQDSLTIMGTPNVTFVLPSSPILTGESNSYSVTAEFSYHVHVDGFQVTVSPQLGWTTFTFSRIFTTRGTHEIMVSIEDQSIIPYLNVTTVTSIITVKEELMLEVLGPSDVNETDSAFYQVFVKGKTSGVGVGSASLELVVSDGVNQSVVLTLLTSTSSSGSATFTLPHLSKGKYMLNFIAWHPTDQLWHGQPSLNRSLTVWDPLTNLTVLLPTNDTIYRINNVTVKVLIAPEDADANVTWQLQYQNGTSSQWKDYLVGGLTSLSMNFDENGVHSFVLLNLTNGSYRLLIFINGSYRIPSQLSIYFTVSLPRQPISFIGDITGSPPLTKYFNTSSITFTVVNASQWYEYRYYLVENIHVSNQTFLDAISLSLLSEGTYIIHVYVGNDGVQYYHVRIKVVIDFTPPVIYLLSPVNGSIYSGISVYLEASVNEPLVSWWYRLDTGTTWYSWNGSSFDLLDVHSLLAGNHSLTLRAQDLAGNLRYITTFFTIDYLVPEFEILSPQSGDWLTTRNVTITLWLISDPQNVTFIYWINGSFITFNTTATTFWLTVPSDGSYIIHVKAVNSWYNVSSEKMIRVNVDATAPSIVILEPANGSTHHVPWINVSVQVMDLFSGTSEVHYQLLAPNGSVIIVNVSFTDGRILLKGLYSNGTYTLVVQANDAVGNQARVIVTFTIDIPALKIFWVEQASYMQLDDGVFLLNGSSLEMTLDGTHDSLYYQLVPVMNGFSSSANPYLLELTFPSDGNYSLMLRVTRFSHEELLITYNFVVDTSPPAVVSVELRPKDLQEVANHVVLELHVNASDSVSPTLRVLINDTLQVELVQTGNTTWLATFVLPITSFNTTSTYIFNITVLDWLNWTSPVITREFTYVPPSVTTVTWTPDPNDDHRWEVEIKVKEGTFELKEVSATVITSDGVTFSLSLRKRIMETTYVGLLQLDYSSSLPSWWNLSMILNDGVNQNHPRQYWFSPYWENGLPTVTQIQLSPVDARNRTWFLSATINNIPKKVQSFEVLAMITSLNDTGIIFVNMTETTSNDVFSAVFLITEPGTYALNLNVTVTTVYGIDSRVITLPNLTITWPDQPPEILALNFTPLNATHVGVLARIQDDYQQITRIWVNITAIFDLSLHWQVHLEPLNQTWYHGVIVFEKPGNYSVQLVVEDDVGQVVASELKMLSIAGNSLSSSSPVDSSPSSDQSNDFHVTPSENATDRSDSAALNAGGTDSPSFVSTMLAFLSLMGLSTVGWRIFRKHDGF